MPRGHSQPPLPTSPGQDEARLRRLEEALSEGRAREAAAVEAWVRHTGHLPPRKVRRQWEKKWRKEAKRAARRAEKEARAAREHNPARGGVYAAAAVSCVLMALAQPRRLWWLVFVALVFFLLAARHLERPRRGVLPEPVRGPGEAEGASTGWASGKVGLGTGDAEASLGGPGARQSEGAGAAELRRLAAAGRGAAAAAGRGDAAAAGREATSQSGDAVDPRVARVDALCGKLMAELREGPKVLREVVHAPERTVEALRKGCHALVKRERELRALSAPEEARRLDFERESLATRVASERDAVVRERLTGALAALDAQRRQRAELATAADRLDAEHTRLYYTLEGLYAQVLRARTADTADEDVAGAGLRLSVEQLGAEVEAVTQALEEVHGAPPDGRVRTR
ncbi:hypothetical protein [Pyxidicoccus xibeiensis]|uniref:hypothetical protein n=1 Tax=Pyxidicoccus xibeiensis TaxID=2906759 RepID=UPI0020A79A8C|nr:hypothetical protein [Pyxidicoccus xibeiensis]MCP3136253.1 hypothetical protein [Pyxidicoccus xibeiensis]